MNLRYEKGVNTEWMLAFKTNGLSTNEVECECMMVTISVRKLVSKRQDSFGVKVQWVQFEFAVKE